MELKTTAHKKKPRKKSNEMISFEYFLRKLKFLSYSMR